MYGQRITSAAFAQNAQRIIPAILVQIPDRERGNFGAAETYLQADRQNCAIPRPLTVSSFGWSRILRASAFEKASVVPSSRLITGRSTLVTWFFNRCPWQTKGHAMFLGLRIKLGARQGLGLVKRIDGHEKAADKSGSRLAVAAAVDSLFQDFGIIDGGDDCVFERFRNNAGSGFGAKQRHEC
jgi:hypothetical protein